MSSRIRFTTAQQVFDEFPKVTYDIGLLPGQETPLDFARKLVVRSRGFDAIVYAACMLPRREAVWWGCQCVRALNGGIADEALLAAEAWVREPDEAVRRAALQIATIGNANHPTTWLARAAGVSGGSLTAEGAPPVRPPPDSTAINLKAGIILSLVKRPMPEIPAWVAACAEAAMRFAEGGDATVRAPGTQPRKAGAV
jgi:hypothetical protein